jgi:hypothetical protein
LRKLKLNDIAAMEPVKVINGYGYLSSQVIAMILELIPQSLRFREISRMFPVSIQKQVLDTPFNWKKMIRVNSPHSPSNYRSCYDSSVHPSFIEKTSRCH